MVFELNYFHELPVRRDTGYTHTAPLELLSEGHIELIPMTVSFMDQILIICLKGEASGFQLAWICSEPHGGPFVGKPVPLLDPAFTVNPLLDEVDNGATGCLVEFRAVGILEVAQMPPDFNNGKLHAKAQAKVGDLILPAYCIAFILPSMPLSPNPPGTSIPFTPSNCVKGPFSRSSEST